MDQKNADACILSYALVSDGPDWSICLSQLHSFLWRESSIQAAHFCPGTVQVVTRRCGGSPAEAEGRSIAPWISSSTVTWCLQIHLRLFWDYGTRSCFPGYCPGHQEGCTHVSVAFSGVFLRAGIEMVWTLSGQVLQWVGSVAAKGSRHGVLSGLQN